ncbi:MAG: HAD-IB family hydrolase, partial [Deltaproteobacteria bacterium]|nr:HAD-IB family hydrolase [Deltaproteobacteria bacterium]
MKKVAAVFDFDGTLSRGECGLRFFRYLLGRRNFVQFALKNSFWLSCYGLHVQDENALKKITQSVFQGKKAADVEAVGEKFARDVMPRYLNPTMIQRLKWHQDRGHRCIVISRSFDVYTRAWAKQYGVGEISVTELETAQDGTFTGKILGASCVGPEKARRLHALLGDRSQYIVYAYGDSDGDKELLASADYAYQLHTEHIPFTANPFPTVLITGASSGIGYQLAHRFAQQHHNLVIVGRDSQKLEQLAQDCRENYQCQVLTIVKDLTAPN